MHGKTADFVKKLMSIGQDNYPEILGKMFIINAPWAFHALWTVFKHFVDEKTRNKINILGSSYKKELLECIDEENLPDFLGGKATVKDYGENFTNNQGPWVPYQEEYRRKRLEKLKPKPIVMIKEIQEKKYVQEESEVLNTGMDSDDIDSLDLWTVPIVRHENLKVNEVRVINHMTITTLSLKYNGKISTM